MIKVLIVDDSATARAVLKEILSKDPMIRVVGAAPDAFIARDMIIDLHPDVICLDVEMPRMDGITFLRKLMQHKPTPVVMVSSLTRKGADITLQALEAGAVDFITKPHSNIYDGKSEIETDLITKVKTAARAKVIARRATTHIKPMTSLSETTHKLIAIGASTGGTEAIKAVLMRMPRNAPGIIIVQHMPPSFTGPFAARLNELCEIEVKEATNGESVGIGKALIAPGDYHMVLRRSGAFYRIEIGSGEKVSGHRPSVDVLFNSVAKSAGANALGILLTGMGSDGARGLLKMREAGAHTIVQDEATCIVYGMPKVARELGAAVETVPLQNIAERALKQV